MGYETGDGQQDQQSNRTKDDFHMMRLAPFLNPGASPFGFQAPFSPKIPGTFNPPPMGFGLGGMGKPRKPGNPAISGIGGLGGAAKGMAQRAMY